MIDEQHPIFQTVPCLSGYGYEFAHSLSKAIERHMSTSPNTFHVDALRKEFREVCGVTASRQAYYSALSTLMRQGKVAKDGRGVYRHTKW